MEENFNKHLGNKLKLRRLALSLTQTKVAKAINVTFQQIQKYEKGTNGGSFKASPAPIPPALKRAQMAAIWTPMF